MVSSASALSEIPSSRGMSCTRPKFTRSVGAAGPCTTNGPRRAILDASARVLACRLDPARKRTSSVSNGGACAGRQQVAQAADGQGCSLPQAQGVAERGEHRDADNGDPDRMRAAQ